MLSIQSVALFLISAAGAYYLVALIDRAIRGKKRENLQGQSRSILTLTYAKYIKEALAFRMKVIDLIDELRKTNGHHQDAQLLLNSLLDPVWSFKSQMDDIDAMTAHQIAGEAWDLKCHINATCNMIQGVDLSTCTKETGDLVRDCAHLAKSQGVAQEKVGEIYELWVQVDNECAQKSARA